jgi:hypothetical protein
VEKVPYLSEVEHEGELDLLRAIESDLGVSDVVAPKAGSMNAPVTPPAVPVPGPVAEPVPAAEQAPPIASPEVAAAPEATNAFSGTEPAT